MLLASCTSPRNLIDRARNALHPLDRENVECFVNRRHGAIVISKCKGGYQCVYYSQLRNSADHSFIAELGLPGKSVQDNVCTGKEWRPTKVCNCNRCRSSLFCQFRRGQRFDR